MEAKEKAIDLLYKLQNSLNELKNNHELREYQLPETRKKQYEVILKIFDVLYNDSLEKKELLYNYTRDNIGFKRNKYKNFPIPVEPEYKNITDEKLSDILNILEIESDRVIIKDSM